MLVLPVNETILLCFIVLTVPCPMTIFAFTLVLKDILSISHHKCKLYGNKATRKQLKSKRNTEKIVTHIFIVTGNHVSKGYLND